MGGRTAERDAGIEEDPLRRLAALLPRETELASDVATRLKLSNKARKRLACAADGNLAGSPELLAYFAGSECAVDRLLLSGRTNDAAQIAEWTVPRLPITGGALIARGLREGPVVARTLRSIENRWAESGFPAGEAFEAIVDEELARMGG